MTNRIDLTEIIKTRKINNEDYQISQYSLYVDNDWFNPDKRDEHSFEIQKRVQHRYWNSISKLYNKDYRMVIKLSGLHFNINDVKDYIFINDERNNMILHYHEWEARGGRQLTDYFALIECDKRIFRELFNKFWFALGFELRFEGILLNTAMFPAIEKWSRRSDNSKKHNDLLRMSALYFDNMHNGFHYQIITKAR